MSKDSQNNEIIEEEIELVPKRATSGLRIGLYIAILVLVAILSFGLGRLSKIEDMTMPLKISTTSGEPVQLITGSLYDDQAQKASQTTKIGDSSTYRYVASKSGTKYHLPNCPGAQTINDENKVWFKTISEAEAAGYSKASNCPGL